MFPPTVGTALAAHPPLRVTRGSVVASDVDDPAEKKEFD
jgi:hypothetical protein